MEDEELLTELLGDNRTGDLDEDLFAAARESQRIRERNSLLGGEALARLRERGHSYRTIEERTGISKSRAQRWAQPPAE